MNWLKQRKERMELGPIPPEIIQAHQEAQAVKAQAMRASGAFHRLGSVMTEWREINNVAAKLAATYEHKGLF